MKTHSLRLILGDQLNPQHSWFQQVSDEHVYVMLEMRQETDYVLHHAQKIIAIFAAMRAFAHSLQQAGHRVHYQTIQEADPAISLPMLLDQLLLHYQCTELRYQEPDEYRLDQQLAAYQPAAGIPKYCVSSEHFFTLRHEVAAQFKGKSRWLMEHFYRAMRARHQILMEQDQPAGGQWNYDADNRAAWSGLPWEPADQRPVHDHSQLWQDIQAAGVASFGEPQAAQFRWPLNRTEALQQLQVFVSTALPHFGSYQDAMSHRAWRLFHSLLSFALNTKMLNPAEVVHAVEQEWRAARIPLHAAEGFIRQILGWREYVRGVYWARMPDYVEQNHFDHQQPLPAWFWTGQTRMHCVSSAIGQSLEHAYAHHIQRLMVIGNFALLAGLQPQAVHQWYLGIYIDAFEWVELPNTLGMSQYADGGFLATKPYVSTATYIDKMGDYCKGCYYDKKQKTGERACPFNALYWDFFARNAEQLSRNPRIGMVYPQWRKMSPEIQAAYQQQAQRIRDNLDSL
ncbi:cryptochrome/photolyase family protein [Undibacterium crateris]|uniref:cryptochrome/photolyase family protein n=1 Tax=Undibacterium crateris TaxID=2528175 RepID=UPI00138A073F|nr:cryptochrome/photolyase family protein [Undibacterium crateris]NDI86242.1 cryptochrome/photolyase family protein [Undibacterium crateris]